MSADKIEHICNWCGESCTLGPLYDDVVAHGGLIDAVVQGGYDSTPGNGNGALDDMTAYSFSLCEFCLDYLFQQFRIPPTVRCLIDNKEETYRPAPKRVKEDEWRTQKEIFLREEGRRNLTRPIKK